MSTDLGGSLRCGALLILSVAGCRAPLPAGPSKPAVPFQRSFYEPTTGEVGKHMSVALTTYVDDQPSEGCYMVPNSISYTGTLPPGLELPPGRVYFEGTPWQAGEWDVTVHLEGVHCTQGPDQSDYGARTINVHFSIAEGYYDDDYW